AALPSERELVGRHLAQRLADVAVPAAHLRPGDARPLARLELPARQRLDPAQDGFADVLGLLHRQAALHRAGHPSGDVVGDARAIGRQRVVDVAGAALEADLELRGHLRTDLRIAHVEVAVAARRGLEALAHVAGAEGARDVGIG